MADMREIIARQIDSLPFQRRDANMTNWKQADVKRIGVALRKAKKIEHALKIGGFTIVGEQ